MSRTKEFFSLNRPDGRPEVYTLAPHPHQGLIGAGYFCALCQHERGASPAYSHTEAFMCSPVDAVDTQAHIVCHAHLPENVVIFDWMKNQCRDKKGENVWTEGETAADPLVRELFDNQVLDPRIEQEMKKGVQ